MLYVEQCTVYVIYAPTVFVTSYMWPETMLFCCHPFSFVNRDQMNGMATALTHNQKYVAVYSTSTKLMHGPIVGSTFGCVDAAACCAWCSQKTRDLKKEAWELLVSTNYKTFRFVIVRRWISFSKHAYMNVQEETQFVEVYLNDDVFWKRWCFCGIESSMFKDW